MSASVRLSPETKLSFDAVITQTGAKAILMSFIGDIHGVEGNCCLIPVGCVGAVIASLELVANRGQHVVPVP